ncbi:DUF4230 domain-containing protein [Leptolyngbya sp. PCC 6406]|uniref:DUF4230 domain-containing protein n=1 Tax=Leptolyngbya sp. PCC 6406 TaxID=1173264 RepID=UPI0002ACCA53|nr:DUF4230 domain-containing protein [Leptolyngbya sp. PCC 6406]
MQVKPPSHDTPPPPYSQWGYQSPPPPPKTPLILRILKALAGSLSGGMLVLGIIVGIGLWRSGEQFVNGIKMALTPQPPQEEVDVRTVVVQQVRGASELTTAVFAMEAVVPATSSRTVANYEIGKTTLIYVAYGEVRAGVDLSEITAADVRVNGETLRVILPPPKILDSKIDVSRSDVYDYSRGFLGLGPDRAPELQGQAQEAALQKVMLAACEEGILQEASARAELVVAQLLAHTDFGTVEVESRLPENTGCATAAAGALQ